MRFIHISDLHLGKFVHGKSMLELQKEVLNELVYYMTQEKITTIVIAGDIYDRLVPPVEAVELFDDFLACLINDHQIQVLMISGNHDSNERLHYASSILRKNGCFVSTNIKKGMDVVEREDEYGKIRFYLLPFIKPGDVKEVYPDEKIKTYQDAIALLLKKQPLDLNCRNVLVTHQFVAGKKDLIRSESESMQYVGEAQMVGVDLFDDFDYVALGHIHAFQKVGKESICYSGSLLRYSFDEVKQTKGFLDVEIKKKGNVTYQLIPFHPSLTLVAYQGYFNDFMNEKQNIIENKEDYIAFELLDTSLIPNAMDTLRTYYPNALKLTYAMLEKNTTYQSQSRASLKQKSDTELFSDFYKMIKDQPLSSENQKIVAEMLMEEKL